MNPEKLIELANKRIGSLTLSELMEALEALEGDNMAQAELLDSIRKRNTGDIGSHLLRWLFRYHQADIDLHGEL